VAVQVALCALCLAGGGIFLQGLYRQLAIDPGFDTRHLLWTSFNLQTLGLDEARGRLLQRRLLERAAGLPGVREAALSEAGPLQGFRMWRDVTRVSGVDVVPAGGRRAKQVGSLAVGSGYFRTLGIPLEQGRDFGAADHADAEPVVIVNRELARRFWTGASPLGEVMLLDDDPRPLRVVGIAGNSKVMDLQEAPMPLLYLPLEQRYSPRAALAVRASGRPEGLVRSLRSALREAAPELPASDPKTASETLARALWAPRAGALTLSILGALAFALALFGVYGITAHGVAQRRREIAIRLALGARPAGLVRGLAAGGIGVLLAGLVLGLGAAHLASGWLLKISSGGRGDEAAALGAIALLVSLVGTLANVLPAVRVVRTHPAVELRRAP
jgi:predicted permease